LESCFVYSGETKELRAIAYVMSQEEYVKANAAGAAADLTDFNLTQRPVCFVEKRSGVDF
jgi:hypothetical protein